MVFTESSHTVDTPQTLAAESEGDAGADGTPLSNLIGERLGDSDEGLEGPLELREAVKSPSEANSVPDGEPAAVVGPPSDVIKDGVGDPDGAVEAEPELKPARADKPQAAADAGADGEAPVGSEIGAIAPLADAIGGRPEAESGRAGADEARAQAGPLPNGEEPAAAAPLSNVVGEGLGDASGSLEAEPGQPPAVAPLSNLIRQERADVNDSFGAKPEGQPVGGEEPQAGSGAKPDAAAVPGGDAPGTFGDMIGDALASGTGVIEPGGGGEPDADSAAEADSQPAAVRPLANEIDQGLGTEPAAGAADSHDSAPQNDVPRASQPGGVAPVSGFLGEGLETAPESQAEGAGDPTDDDVIGQPRIDNGAATEPGRADSDVAMLESVPDVSSMAHVVGSDRSGESATAGKVRDGLAWLDRVGAEELSDLAAGTPPRQNWFAQTLDLIGYPKFSSGDSYLPYPGEVEPNEEDIVVSASGVRRIVDSGGVLALGDDVAGGADGS